MGVRTAALSQKGGSVMNAPLRKQVLGFVNACDNLLEPDVEHGCLTATEHQIIQHYLSAMSVKYPPLL